MTHTMNEFLYTAMAAASAAGKAVLDVYHTDFSVAHKADASPLTQADRSAHDVIVRRLDAFGIPVLSEEGKQAPYEMRRKWDRLWLVDPLDGTKEFVNRNGEFTVNIALVQGGSPGLGVVYIPVQDLMYFAAKDAGAYKLEKASAFLEARGPNSAPVGNLRRVIHASSRLPLKGTGNGVYTIVGSRSHASAALDAFVREVRREKTAVEFVSAGSSMKFCLVAEGRADIYPRFGPTMEWDTAAGQAVAENAGLEVVDHKTGSPLVYNKENLLNPWFVVRRPGIHSGHAPAVPGRRTPPS